MKSTIQQHIFTFYLPMTAASLVSQLLIAAYIIWMYWDVMRFTIWSDEENREFFEQQGKIELVQMGPVRVDEDHLKEGVVVSVRAQPSRTSEEGSVFFDEER